jgi:tetratricopeptide (TPR) repeat protein
LGLEELGRWGEALAMYERALQGSSKADDKSDALFRIGECHEKLEQWSAMEKTFEQVLAMPLTVLDRAEAWTRRGYAWQRMGDLTQAERAYKECLTVYNDNISLRLFEGNYWVSMAQFQLGEIYRTLFDGIAFRLPVERMERDLEDKSNLFLKAQHAYLKSVRLRNTEWAIAAGFRLGSMYEDFYADMLQAEYPAELGEQEVALYFSELKGQILPLVQRAVEIYERNLAMSERVGARDTEWASRTKKHLEHLRGLLEQEERRQEDELREDAESVTPPSARR